MARKRTSAPVLGVWNFEGRLYRHAKARQVRWSSYDGEEGGGFGTLSWRLDRAVGRDYADVGYFYPVKVWRGLRTILFHGFVVDIEEVQSQGEEYQVVTALGWSSVFGNDVLNKVYQDARPGEWVGTETVSGSCRPDAFDWSTNGKLECEPRRGVDYLADDYSYLRYTFQFGESVTGIDFDYEVALPNSWPGKLEVRDSVGVLWSSTSTGSGSQSLSANSGATYFEVRFYVTTAGENTAADDTVYGRLTKVQVKSQSGTVTIKDVLEDAVALLADHGLSSDTSKIENVGAALPPTVAFEDDQSPLDVMKWCAQFKSSNGKALSWGVEMNDKARVFLKEQDLTTVRYYVDRGSGLQAQVKGSASKSGQKVYVTYKDEDNQVQRTAVASDSNQIERFGGRYRKVSKRVGGNLDATTAEGLAGLALADMSGPEITTSFTVTDYVYSATGKRVPVEEIQAGGMVVVGDFRGREATQSGDDYRTQWSSFYLVGVEIDLERKSARLIPAGDRHEFERMMAEMAAYRN
jgi:hypothetical protein